MELKTNSLIRFTENYKEFSKRIEKQKIIYYETKFTGLLLGYNSLQNIIKIFNRKEASDYNIFDILNIKGAETKTHTPFLCNLLNPEGTHG
ncbi:MAG: hypothetical protein JRJ49_06030 [Deltaproteobacteria bacterium]|nr:hypothetical protein [Deltaproteobacteria bacterium]